MVGAVKRVEEREGGGAGGREKRWRDFSPALPLPRSPAFGIHAPIAAGLHRSILDAAAKGCRAWQIFSRNPRGWAARPLAADEIELFRRTREECGLGPCVIHACYLINLATGAPDVRAKSVAAFRDEVERGMLLGAECLVVHPGSRGGRDSGSGASVDEAIENCACAIDEATRGLADEMRRAGLMILIENTAGQGGQIGRSFEEVCDIIARCEAKSPGLNVGMCLDTAHSFAAGYDWRDARAARRAFNALGATVGFERVKAVHFNDSKAAFASQVDRHWHIGLGAIGSEGLARVLNHPRLRGLPFILETPQDDERDDAANLAAARALVNKRKARAA
jgi:deoxyribonuclease IV